jgi:hypothetical protein
VKTEYDRRPRTSDIRLDAISSTEWRVCDRTADADDHLSILGFIELRDRKYEVLRMSAPRDLLAFPTLAEAREAFAFSSVTRIP